MEYLEIVLIDLNKNNLDEFVYNELKLQSSTIISSHFHDNKLNKDLEFSQFKSLKSILSPIGTGNTFVEKLHMGINLQKVMIVYSFDEKLGDIVMNFPNEELFTESQADFRRKFTKLVGHLDTLKRKYKLKSIKIGFEPAVDDDMLLLELNKDDPNYREEIKRIMKYQYESE